MVVTLRLSFSVSAAVIVLGLTTSLGGCVGVVVGAGASAGVAASDERGFDGVVDDTKIRAEINDLWFKHDIEMYRQVTLNVNEGRVLLTGTLDRPEQRVDAVRLAWQAAGVREVLNELKVKGEAGSGGSYGQDVAIAQKLRTRLLFDREIRNINYTIDVTNAVVYLMGIAQSQQELERVIGHAREISGVRGVVNHVRLKDDPRRIGG